MVVDNHYPPARRFAPILVGGWVGLIQVFLLSCYLSLLLLLLGFKSWCFVLLFLHLECCFLHSSELGLRIRISECFF